MIISASRRTDIPSYYSEWFMNRIKEGFLYVRTPMNVHQVSKISLSPDVVDGIVFWTKNPAPMMDKLDLLSDYAYYFQFTVNSYARDIEPNIPNKNDTIIPLFKKLSNRIGKDRVIWRYDPILLTEKYTIEYQELICKGWFLPPNTYDCGSFVVNGKAVVGKELNSYICKHFTMKGACYEIFI